MASLDAELEAVGSDWQRAEELSAERARVSEALDDAEHRWLELAERA